MYDNIIKLAELEDIKELIFSLDVTTNNNEIRLHIKLRPVKTTCSHCYSDKYKIHDYVKKQITHSTSVTRKVYIDYKQRRYKCFSCSKTFYEVNPFSVDKQRISKLTVMNVLNYLLEPNHTFSSTGRTFNISSQSVINIFDQYVKPKRLKLPKILCIDEIHIRSNIKHPFAAVLLDFTENKIVDVLETRRKGYLIAYFQRLSVQELDNVEIVVMDMWSPYRDVVRRVMPKAKIVVDSFHVVSLINKILDKKRIQVMNRYREFVGSKNYFNDYYYLLKKFSWMIRTRYGNINPRNYRIHKYKINVSKYNLINHLLKVDKELYEIYKIKEQYLTFTNDSTSDDAEEKLLDLIYKLRNHEVDDIRYYGQTLYRWKTEIINSFTTIQGKKYSNGKLESRNRHIKTLIRNGYGYKNFQRLRARAIYCINKDVPLNLIIKK